MQSRLMDTHAHFPLDEATASVELRKRILKLRWIGEESEAERLCTVLAQTARDHIVVDELPTTD